MYRTFKNHVQYKGSYINYVRFFGGRGSKITPKKRIIEGKDRIKGGKGVKNDSKKSFMYDPLGGVGASDMIDIAYSSLL